MVSIILVVKRSSLSISKDDKLPRNTAPLTIKQKAIKIDTANLSVYLLIFLTSMDKSTNQIMNPLYHKKISL